MTLDSDKTSKVQENQGGNVPVGSSTDESEEDAPTNPRMFGFTLKPQPKPKTSGRKKARTTTTKAPQRPAKYTSASLSWPSRPVDRSGADSVARNEDQEEEALAASDGDGDIEVSVPTAKASEEFALAEVEMEAHEIIQAAERAEQESQPASQPVAPAPAPAVALPARSLPIGVIGYEKAPMKGRGSFCYFCNSFITKGSWRFEYRFSASGKIPRWIHPSCTLHIPVNGRDNSIKFLEGLLASAGSGDGQGLDEALLSHVRDSLKILRAIS